MLWGQINLSCKRDFYSRKTKTYFKHRCNNECLYSYVEDYGARAELEKLGIEITHTGQFLTNALKDETFSVLTI